MAQVWRHELERLVDKASSSSSSHRFTLVHAPLSWPFSGQRTRKGKDKEVDLPRIHIAVLDSSFNPPTLAHEIIASSPLPARVHTPLIDGGATEQDTGRAGETSRGGYTARLLLFSFRNVDKHLKPHDPTVLQRLEMMLLLAKRVEERTGQEVGIGLVDEPTFAGKDRVVREWLDRRIAKQAERIPKAATLRDTDSVDDDRNGDATQLALAGSNSALQQSDIELTFLLGTDTLIRFFDPKYYPPNEMLPTLTDFFTRSSIVSAQRGEDDTSQGVEAGVLSRPEVQQWVESGKVRLTGAFKEGREDVSSTRVREAVKQGKKEELRGLVSEEIREYIGREGLYV